MYAFSCSLHYIVAYEKSDEEDQFTT